MENAVDALKMAFAVIVFVMALSISINMFSNARETADVVLHSSDITEYMQYQEAVEGTESRIVGLETIIPTLYKYYKENYTVIFRDKKSNYMTMYTSKTNQAQWSSNYSRDYNKGPLICAFDVDDETKRHEPWTGSHEEYRKNINAFLSGTVYEDPSGNSSLNYDYGEKGGFIKQYGGRRFKENLGEYIYNKSNEEDVKKKRIIIYTLL